jgi:hypothetical protein
MQVTLHVIDNEILSTAIRIEPLLSYQFLSKVKATSTGNYKLLDSVPRNDTVAELSSGKFNVT